MKFINSSGRETMQWKESKFECNKQQQQQFPASWLQGRHKNMVTFYQNISVNVLLEVNAEKTKCMVMSRHQNAGQSHNLLIANTVCILVNRQNFIHEKNSRSTSSPPK
jgi:hypothetical protein